MSYRETGRQALQRRIAELEGENAALRKGGEDGLLALWQAAMNRLRVSVHEGERRIAELEAECLSRGKEASESRDIYMAEIKALRAGLEDKIGVDGLNTQLVELDQAKAEIARLTAINADLNRIAELEAERDNAERERFRFGALNKGLSNRIAELEAAGIRASNEFSIALRDSRVRIAELEARVAELEAALEHAAAFLKSWDDGFGPDPDNNWNYDEMKSEYEAILAAIRGRPAP